MHVSRIGVIPKKKQLNKIIVDMSHPAGYSINDEIMKELCSLFYMSVDSAIKII